MPDSPAVLSPLDVEACRSQFPALARTVAGRPAVFFDGPGGSQVPRRVIQAVARSLAETNANHGGLFATSRESDRLLHEAHAAVADFLGADDPDSVVFGANMTTLTLAASRALARTWRPGDEVVVTRLDHDANVTPWVLAAADAGAVVRRVDVRLADCTLDLDDLAGKLNSRTRLVAVGAASNSVGTINPVAEVVRLAHEFGALVYVDAVHWAPHGRIDVRRWDCDFLACSAYKFFGPHVGALWGRRQLLAGLPVYKLRPAPETLPGRWMTGTQNHEGIVGTLEAIEYLADIGRQAAGDARLPRRAALDRAAEAIGSHERRMCGRLLEVLTAVPGLEVRGITDPARLSERVPTVSFTHRSLPSSAVAARLGEAGVFAWHGNYYALSLSEALGVEPEGMVRVGLLHYNTAGEIDRLAEALAAL